MRYALVLLTVGIFGCSSAPQQAPTPTAAKTTATCGPEMTIDRWINRLGWKDTDAHAEAVQVLLEIGDTVIPHLERSLADQSQPGSVNASVLSMLVRFNPKKYDNASLERIVLDSGYDREVRSRAVVLLANDHDYFEANGSRLHKIISDRVRKQFEESHGSPLDLINPDRTVSSELDHQIRGLARAKEIKALVSSQPKR